MELKVWVDGIQRVVCGINDQTTVQEVVIALAQATGRTGRYTLVEKWKQSEKMLPPLEHPLQVMSRWGDLAGEIQFVLRRTGASTSMSESGEDKAVIPERSAHRSSLPPQLKHKQKKEAILNRKEPKRKSLDITGGGNSDSSLNKYKTRGGERRSGAADKNKNEKLPTSSPKKALIPPVFLNRPDFNTSASSLKNARADQQQNPTISTHPQSHQSLPPKKKPLMPPPRRDLRHPENQTSFDFRTKAVNRNVGEERPPSRSMQSGGNRGSKVLTPSKLVDTVEACAEFTRLVLKQHEHVDEQNLTLKSLNEELDKYEAMIQRRENSEALLKKEIESLEESIRKSEVDLKKEKSLQELLQNEGYKGNTLQSENNKSKADLLSIKSNMKELDERIVHLQQEIEEEKAFQERRKEENFQNRYRNTELELLNANDEVSDVISQLKTVEDDIDITESAVNEKEYLLETLNRELRQVNLQQFIRQTGSKVTVLPSDVDKGNFEGAQGSSLLPPSGGGEVGGVWV